MVVAVPVRVTTQLRFDSRSAEIAKFCFNRWASGSVNWIEQNQACVAELNMYSGWWSTRWRSGSCALSGCRGLGIGSDYGIFATTWSGWVIWSRHYRRRWGRCAAICEFEGDLAQIMVFWLNITAFWFKSANIRKMLSGSVQIFKNQHLRPRESQNKR